MTDSPTKLWHVCQVTNLYVLTPASGVAVGTRAVERIEEIDARSTVLTRSTHAFVVVHLAVNADETGRTRTSVSMGVGHTCPVVDARLAATGIFL